MAEPPADRISTRVGLRAVTGYAIVAILTVAGLAVAWWSGSGTVPPFAVGGRYMLDADVPCVGSSGTVVRLTQSGVFVSLTAVDAARSKASIDMRMDDRHMAGAGRCADGSSGSVAIDASGSDRA